MRVRWVLAGFGLLLAAGCSGNGGSAAPKVAIDHSTTTAAVAPLADTGPAPGTLGESWHVDVRTPQGEADLVSERLVDGQLVVGTHLGIDVYDATTGRPRWHYHEPGRNLDGYGEPAGSLVAVTKHGSDDDDRWTGLDEKTGRVLWAGGGRGYPLLSGQFNMGAGSGVVGTSVPDGEHHFDKIRGIDVRTGHTRWTRQPNDHGCKSYALETGRADTDGSLFVVTETCLGKTRAFALDPATGRKRWTRDLPETSQIVVRHGFSLIVSSDRQLSVVSADGRDVVGGQPYACSVCRFDVIGGTGFVTGDAKLLLVNLRDGRVTPRPVNGESVVTTAGGQMYAIRSWLGHAEMLAAQPLPAGFDVVDQAGNIGTRPLPFAVADNGLGQTGIGWIAVAGGRFYIGRVVSGTARITAYAVTRPGTPAELGGVKQPDWPDACALAPGHKPLALSPSDTSVTVGSITLPHVVCALQMSGGDVDDLSIKWVAPTPGDAHRLLPPVVDSRPLTAVRLDGADEAYQSTDPGRLWFRAGRYILSVDKDDAPARELASAAAKSLRTR